MHSLVGKNSFLINFLFAGFGELIAQSLRTAIRWLRTAVIMQPFLLLKIQRYTKLKFLNVYDNRGKWSNFFFSFSVQFSY